ncbi:MAG TPA: hypothetical protein VLG50_07270 [Candidatus Saccharimonadales bacterium]|nr:hypothetical protein [Candidatus Saccharimonadales bacterium]
MIDTLVLKQQEIDLLLNHVKDQENTIHALETNERKQFELLEQQNQHIELLIDKLKTATNQNNNLKVDLHNCQLQLESSNKIIKDIKKVIDELKTIKSSPYTYAPPAKLLDHLLGLFKDLRCYNDE